MTETTTAEPIIISPKVEEPKETSSLSRETPAVLDVGGPMGDIGINLTRGDFVDVICTAECLPFPNNTFEEVHSSHVIEHVSNPAMMLDEMVRVSKHVIFVSCPHRLSPWAGRFANKDHKHLFNLSWFRDYCKSRRLKISGEICWTFSRFLELRVIICKIV